MSEVAGGALRERPFAVRFWDGSEMPATVTGEAPTIVLRDPAAIAHILREPNDLGLGRAWVAGMLEVEGDLDFLLGLRRSFYGMSVPRRERIRALTTVLRSAGLRAVRRPPQLQSEVRVSGKRHSRRRDSTVVRHHYDAPENFYRLVLGPSMVYSCAYFESPAQALEPAQSAKLDLICRKLRLQPEDRLLDIGCGWGSLIAHAAEHYGVRAVGITLSPVQAEAAKRRVEAAGVAARCEVRVMDYRELSEGGFDAVASVGMYEHVARRDYGRYAGTLMRLLKPGGRVLNHGIAHIEPGPDHDRTFMRRFVFPDAELQPLPFLLEALAGAGLEVRDVESLREHYVLTLRRWLANLAEHRDEAIRVGGAERERIWRLYMAGAARAFSDNEISVFQTLAIRPGGSHRLPLDRRQLLAPA
ncbi:MAG: Cyclopropane-fatty-acyl-phospholipid synthase, partial [uncultured Solirubrobacteraceae bacterium]